MYNLSKLSVLIYHEPYIINPEKFCPDANIIVKIFFSTSISWIYLVFIILLDNTKNLLIYYLLIICILYDF
jgi:hypothetical protein